MLLRSMFAARAARRTLAFLMVFAGLLSAESAAARAPLSVGLSVPLAWVRWSDNLFQEGSLTRAETSSSLLTGALVTIEHGVVAARLGAIGSVGETRFAPYMPPFALEPYRAPRSLHYLVTGVVIRRPSIVLRSDTDPPGVHWLPRAGLSYWTNLSYEDEFHGESRESLPRAERIELDELFFEFGVDAEFLVHREWAGRFAILIAYNLLGEDLAWMEGVTVMETTRYLPVDAGVAAEFSIVRRLW